MRRLGIIGAGGMATTLARALAAHLPARLEHLSVLALPQDRAAAEALGAGLAETTAVHTDLGAFLADRPEVVAECAGHVAVRDHGAGVLESGRDLLVISIGALADDGVRDRLYAAARLGGSRLILSPGAVGGIDVLAAARLSGLEDVVYVGRKPPHAWRGTPAEHLLDLDALTGPATFFEGTARDAARDYPQNANVAATVALAGAGFAATRVRLIADPSITRNIHEVSVRSGCADFTIRLEGRASSANPKTSLTAGFSMARALLNRVTPVVI